MTLPPDEVIEDTQQKNNNKDMIEHIRSFNIKPKEVKTYLDRFIINQMDAKKALAIAIVITITLLKKPLIIPHPVITLNKTL